MNKLLIFLFALAIIFVSCNTDNKESNNKDSTVTTEIVNNNKSASLNNEVESFPEIVFENESHDFGEITQGEKVMYTFKFKNTGSADLVISKAKGSCGCTVPEWPKEPIPPGEEGDIRVIFDSSGKKGKQNKRVTIIANTNPNSKVLTITGNVNVAEENN